MKKLSRQHYWVATLANALVILFILAPFLPLVIGAFSTERSLQADTTSLGVTELTLDNFKLIFSGTASEGSIFGEIAYLPESLTFFTQVFMNSVIVAVSVCIATIVLATLSALTITRLGMRWTGVLATGAVMSRMVPAIVMMIPLFIIMRGLGALNSLTGIIIAEIGFLVPYGILILTPYFQSLPRSVEEAARIDGCTRFQSWMRMLLPLAAPGLASAAVIVFIISWHEFIIPLILSTQTASMTLPVLLSSLVSDAFVFFTLMMAISLIGLLPTTVLVLLMRKFVVSGLSAGAVKG